jgi:membrane associated rhomboid family serine protease
MTEFANSLASRSDLEIATVHDSLEESAPDCGCQLSAIVASLALIGYFVVTIALSRLNHTTVTFAWWEALAAFLAGAVIGKTLGVFRARRIHYRRRP